MSVILDNDPNDVNFHDVSMSDQSFIVFGWQAVEHNMQSNSS